jgi:hypothetical protein
MIYMKIPLGVQFRGLPEVIVQPLLLSLVAWLWVPDSKKRWLDWSLGIAFTLVLLMSILGIMAGRLHVTAANEPGAADVKLGNERSVSFR